MKVFFLTALLAVFTSCTKDKTLPAQCDDVISFAEDVQPIILNSCATTGCHNALSAANDMVFESYESVFEYRDEILKAVRHESGVTPMPIGADQLSEIEIYKID